jgi:aminopeptidase N
VRRFFLVLSLFPLTAYRSPLTGQRHDALHYDISLTLPASDSVFTARVETRWRLTGSGPVILDLDSTLTITAATVNRRPVRWSRRGQTVILPLTGAAGREVTTALSYSGIPRDGLVIRGSGAERTVFADNWPDRARHWLASHDHPRDKASVSWEIRTPAGFAVVATGSLVGVDTLPEGVLRHRFRNPEPVPVYTMVVGMDLLTTTPLSPLPCDTGCVPVTLWTRPEDVQRALDGPFARAGDLVPHFARLFGPFPYRELRHVQSTTRFGGMENATAIFYNGSAIQEGRLRESTVAHETAHQWFGDAVTQSDWHHIWLSEGFATYGAALWAEHTGGDSARAAYLRDARDAIVASTVVDRPILDTTITDPRQLLNANAYQKGAWVLHSLRGLVGDSVFFSGLRRYVRTYLHKNALSADFARIMGAAAGRDLAWYFRQALRQPGYPVLDVEGQVEGGHLVLTIRQVQKRTWGLFRIPNLAVRLDDRMVVVDVRGEVTRMVTHWAGERPPQNVEVDPQGWWLLTVSGKR